MKSHGGKLYEASHDNFWILTSYFYVGKVIYNNLHSMWLKVIDVQQLAFLWTKYVWTF